MLLEKILQAIFEDGQKFQDIATTHTPDAPKLDYDLSQIEEMISDHLTVDQTDWEDFSCYPVYVWQRLKRDAFAAGVQGRKNLDEATDIFGYDNPDMFQKELDYLKSFLEKSVVLQPIHLGKGEQGIIRRVALDRLAAEAGYHWNERPSIGRWLVALADAADQG